ncbi:type 1 glutamine amidotransferase domain-containing protein [Ravibacter arvi]|uniref:Type 1 glutamine amidotransferase domain-containing protein n=1 Tax=Ravibacter arvi TaxID=2051041 RepID=A0ABP8M251_9BACT
MRALVVCTGVEVFPGKGTRTGIWLGELIHFFDVLTEKRIPVDITKPGGGVVPVDPKSQDSKDEIVKRYIGNEAFMDALNRVPALESIDPEPYGVVYLVGGHGAIWDLPGNEPLQKFIEAVYQANGTITAVGHGVAGLLNVRNADGSWFVKDRYLTGFSNMEEKLVSFVSEEVPFYVEDKLIEKGAHFTKTVIPFTEHIEMDERLITGQNPNSARKVAQKLIEELWEK